MSVLPGRRKKEVDHPILGLYRFYPLAMRDGSFLESVNRQTLNEQTALVAEPLRALLDIVCLRKLEPGEMRYLTESMRIDNEEFSSIDPAMWQSAKTAYRHKRMAAWNCSRKSMDDDADAPQAGLPENLERKRTLQAQKEHQPYP